MPLSRSAEAISSPDMSFGDLNRDFNSAVSRATSSVGVATAAGQPVTISSGLTAPRGWENAMVTPPPHRSRTSPIIVLFLWEWVLSVRPRVPPQRDFLSKNLAIINHHHHQSIISQDYYYHHHHHHPSNHLARFSDKKSSILSSYPSNHPTPHVQSK